jgi:hypothetical protein
MAKSPDKYVLYSIEEAGRYSMNVGVGAEIGASAAAPRRSIHRPVSPASARVSSFGISRLNFFGLGHTMSLQTLISTLEQRALLTYVAPQFLGNPNLSSAILGFVRPFPQHPHLLGAARGGLRAIERKSCPGVIHAAIPLHVSRGEYSRDSAHQPDLIPLLSQPVRVGFVSMSFIQDKRDDPIDSHHGTYTSIDVALASPVYWDPKPVSGEWWRAIRLTISSPRTWSWRDHGLRYYRTLRRLARNSRWPNDSSAAVRFPTAPFPIFRPARAIQPPAFPSAATRCL